MPDVSNIKVQLRQLQKMIQDFKEDHDFQNNLFKEKQISSQLDACEQAFIAPESSDNQLQNTSFFAADLLKHED